MSGVAEPATPENDDTDYRGLTRITGTRTRSIGNNQTVEDFFMYNPPFKGGMKVKCGMCHEDMTGQQHCLRCWR